MAKKTPQEKEAEKRELHERWRVRFTQAIEDDLPALVEQRGWKIDEAEEFQRIVLDTICKGVWQDKIQYPPIRMMRPAQLRKAVYLAEELVSGARTLEPLDAQSQTWRKERKQREFG